MPASARTLLALPSALAVLCAAGASAAHAAWTPPQAVTDRAVTHLDGAGNVRGSEAFVWMRTSKKLVRLPTQTGFASYVRARIRLPDGRLGHTQTISSTREVVTDPQVGVAESGDAWAVWTQAGRHIRIMGAFHPRGKPFGTPYELGRSSHFNDSDPVIVVGRFGDVAIAWNAGAAIRVVRRAANARCATRHPSGCFRAAVSLRRGTDHAIALGPLGSAYVVWAANVLVGADFHSELRMTVIRRSNRQGREHAISDVAEANASQPSIAVRRDGTADVAWRASVPAGGEQDQAAPIMAAASSPDAVTSAPQVVAPTLAQRPVLRLDEQGEAILAWDELDSTPQNPDGPQVAVAVRAAGAATFGAPTAISPANVMADTASLAVDAAGSAYVAYAANPVSAATPGGPFGISHVRPAGGAFGPPLALPAGLEHPALISAGAKVTAVGGASDEPLVVSDWQP